jgi:hypothetical protein
MINMYRSFISAFRTALEDQIEGGLADEAKPTDFDIRSLLKGILVELEHTDNPMTAMEIAMDHLAEHAEYYDALELMEKELEDDGKEEENDDNIEEVEEGEPAPDQIASKLVAIADLIDKSNNPSKTKIVKRLKSIYGSLQRHPHLSCQECGAKTNEKHQGWCPLG